MDDLIESVSKPDAAIRERRRPGRLSFTSASLTVLLRQGHGPPHVRSGKTAEAETVEPLEVAVDPEGGTGTLSAARGICLAVGLAIVIWTGIGVVIWHYFPL